MKIAPGLTSSEWKNLALDEHAHQDWNTAVDFLEARIKTRYLNAAKALVDLDEPKPILERSFGFAILGICCIVIETFQSFLEGEPSSDFNSKRMFREFLTTRPRFAEYFVSDELANRFYSEFRCGVLHQAETKASAKVWSVGSLLSINNENLTVNRTAFLNALELEFNDYLSDLRDPTKTDLRENYKKKMDHVCRH